MSKDTFCQPVITCPHCGHKHSDCGEYESNEEIIECSKCEEEFMYVREITVEYSTYLIDDDKNKP